jgi:hypothetical protein
LHACLVLPAAPVLFAGRPRRPAWPHEGIKGAMLALQYDTVYQAQSAFHALSQGGKVTMPADAVLLGEDLRHADRPLRRELGGERRADPAQVTACFTNEIPNETEP